MDANVIKTQLFQKNSPIFPDRSELGRAANSPASVLEAGGKPSTWLPPERLEKLLLFAKLKSNTDAGELAARPNSDLSRKIGEFF